MRNGPPLLQARFSAGYPGAAEVLTDFCLEIGPGEIMGLVGESGSGKSTAALALLRLAQLTGARVRGEIFFDGSDLNSLSRRELQSIRGQEIALVLQSPVSSLNPALKIGTQLREAWRAHKRPDRQREAAAFREALESVNLPNGPEILARYPSQLSVGQAQRVLIAMAVLHRPKLLIADEPTSALDMVTQAEVLRLFVQLRKKRDMAILFISHDLSAVASICDRVSILYGGRVVEHGITSTVLKRPEHAYTVKLLSSLPHANAKLSLGVRPTEEPTCSRS